MKYDFKKIEAKWRKIWETKKLYAAKDSSKKPKYYALVEFPYPSGEGLHVGHVRSYTAMDIIARKRRMEGYNVLYPIGWDAFGLPTENYALKTGIAPDVATKKNTDNFRRQLKSLGFSFDWNREINTTDPNYYKWTQWMFLQFFKHGLAYKANVPINWCPNCKIGLANEEVAAGRCERCEGPVEKRNKEQWMLKITSYADKLLEGLKNLDFLPEIKRQQENWIGKSDGAEIAFQLVASQTNADIHADQRGQFPRKSALSQRESAVVKVFTARPDTIFGATYLVFAPEHEQIPNYKSQITNWEEVKIYIEKAKKKSEEERIAGVKDKTGVELKGLKAVNPATKKEIPIWAADYVLGNVGTGAIMAVPAHDERDHEFALRYKLPIVEVIAPLKDADTNAEQRGKAYTDNGILVNSGGFNGLDSEEAKWAITKFVGGKKEMRYKLRDWVFSRQRYWGEPIPLVFCESCRKKLMGNSKLISSHSERSEESLEILLRQLADQDDKWSGDFSAGERLNPGWIAVLEKDLPVKLPKVKNFKPRDDGQSPLASVESWIKVKCPKCNGLARRETDVMPNWAGSSWYFLAYLMRTKNPKPYTLNPKPFRYWLPVNWYNGGMEHVTLHLLYSRFWNLFLHDINVVPVAEPYEKRTAHGLILGEGGAKMSKSKGNIVNPDDSVKEFGADALRLYEMFIGPFEQAVAWDPHGILGVSRFLERVWNLNQAVILSEYNERRISKKELKQEMLRVAQHDEKLVRLLHKTIKKVTEDIESMSFNTAISGMMIFVNECQKAEKISSEIWRNFLLVLAPFAPHLTEELYSKLKTINYKLKTFKSIHQEKWPEYDKKLVEDETFELLIQVNGKLRDKISVSKSISQKEAEKLALASGKIKIMLGNQKPKKVIFVPGRLINFVV